MPRRVFALALGFLVVLASTPRELSACGVERWSVKTGTDADVGSINMSSSTATTIATMRSWPVPSPIPANNRVSPYETTVWVVNATLTQYKSETDQDYHLVIKDASGNTMIAEIPDPSCVGAGSPFASGVSHSRSQFDAMFSASSSFQTTSTPVQIKGVGMFDFLHGQTGVAPNGIEIHPVLDIIFNPSSNPDFSISASPSTVSAFQGSSGATTVSTSISGGFASAVSLSASGLPAGASASFSPASIASPGSGSSTLTLSAGTAAAGTYNVTVTGTGGGKTHATTVSFTVNVATSVYPESPHPYANNYDNTWTYTLAGAPASINVTFDAQTKVESTYDFIYVMDKNGVNISGSPFTNTTLAGVTKNVPGDTVKIRLTSDVSVTYYGFKVTNVTAGSGGDTTPPSVSISSPASGATITGATTVSATASDNTGVAKVEFYLDGALQTTDTTSPYSWAWSPTSAQNGSHSLTAKAYDAANNSATSSAVPVTVNVSSTCTPQQLIGNGGFETGRASPSTSTAGVIDNGTSEAAHSGSWKAWLNGYGSAHTDTLSQSVSIPACATTANLTFWLHIDTAETTTTSAFDTLTVKVGSTTLATYSNLNAAAGYSQKSLSLASYKGQTVTVTFTGTEGSTLQTSFVIDDVALNTQ